MKRIIILLFASFFSACIGKEVLTEKIQIK